MTDATRRRRFNRTERRALYLLADGRCESCGVELEPGWHADHAEPFSKGGATRTENGQALCPACNLNKGDNTVTDSSPYQWQTELYQAYNEANFPADFLIVATPGAGKTRAAIDIGRSWLEERRARGLIVIAPTARLREQWHDAICDAGIDSYRDFTTSGSTVWPEGYEAIVTTYQMVASSPHVFLRHAANRPALFILDEVHHCGDRKQWGDQIRLACDPAPGRLALSGTPFRNDNNPIPFVRYENGESIADYSYPYARALRDGIVRPVAFYQEDGEMEWLSSDGRVYGAKLSEPIAQRVLGERLATAIVPGSEWLRVVLMERAEKELDVYRKTEPRAAGLVIARNQADAVAIARALPDSVLVISDDGVEARNRIRDFERGSHRWIVSVRMVSEGIDIRRLRVLVYATNIANSELFFRQAVGRIVRSHPSKPREWSSVFLPNDPRLEEYAKQFMAELFHALHEETEPQEKERSDDDTGEIPTRFTPLSQTHEAAGMISHGEPIASQYVDLAERLQQELPGLADHSSKPDIAAAIQRASQPQPDEPSSRADRQQRLDNARTRAHKAAKRIAGRYKLEYNEVHNRLNDVLGVRKTTDVTDPAILERKADIAERWLRTGEAP